LLSALFFSPFSKIIVPLFFSSAFKRASPMFFGPIHVFIRFFLIPLELMPNSAKGFVDDASGGARLFLPFTRVTVLCGIVFPSETRIPPLF